MDFREKRQREKAVAVILLAINENIFKSISVTTLKPNSGWLHRFKKRFGISKHGVVGESKEVD